MPKGVTFEDGKTIRRQDDDECEVQNNVDSCTNALLYDQLRIGCKLILYRLYYILVLTFWSWVRGNISEIGMILIAGKKYCWILFGVKLFII